jgi:hypothetical protein
MTSVASGVPEGAAAAKDLRHHLPRLCPTIFDAFLAAVARVPQLSHTEQQAYTAIVEHLVAACDGGGIAIEDDARFDPRDVERVIRDVLLFVAINSDQLPA